MEGIINQLIQLNFSKTEAMVYVTLVKNGKLTGYKIAKFLGLSRSTVYAALDNLYKRGCIYLISGETNEYEAKKPDLMLEDIKKEIVNIAESLKDSLTILEDETKEAHFINIKGFESVVKKAKELLLSAEKEVYINTDFEFELFKDEFIELNKKGVRIIVVTFSNQEVNDIPIEVYKDIEKSFSCRNTRLMMVVDLGKTLVGSLEGSEFIGSYTQNRLLSRIISEHIHNDIYLMNLKKKHNKNLVDNEILINTIFEN